MSQSKFAQKELKKFGWKEGSGLGKNENGMKEAIKVKIKKDSHGVGHNTGDEFTFHWWDHVFNKAANSIEVNTTKEGVSVRKSKDSGGVSTKKARTFDNKAMLYGQFVKGATLDNNEETHVEDTADREYTEEDEQCIQKLADEEILKICGGMTAHKGARHGLKLNGKLDRIQEQEQLLLEKWKSKKGNNSDLDQLKSVSYNAVTVNSVNKPEDSEKLICEKSRKKKKRKREKDNALGQGVLNIGKSECNESTESTERQICEEVKEKKKKKRKRKVLESESESVELSYEKETQTEAKRTKTKKSRN
ncbi:G patch domain-containing protein 4-like [Saccostrea echinata]|uniref:G patch domain-containing protein 4-like n=1 Tax=Saccostrea echinata TaxID=191078 RepID=UPI002A815CC7|nr:G patch domain-containing protein 4-like [Saccostrea echinata]